MSILELTAVELGKKIKDKEITVVEATKAALEQIKAVEGADLSGHAAACSLGALPVPQVSLHGGRCPLFSGQRAVRACGA